MTESFIQYYDNILNEDVCHTLVETSKLYLQSYKELRTAPGTQQDHRVIKQQQSLEECSKIRKSLYSKIDVEKEVNDALYEVYNKYRKEFPTIDKWEDISFKWKILLTPIGSGIDWHDDRPSTLNLTSWRRQSVFIIYLNDMEEGELQFKYFPDLCILPKVGRALIMPVDWPFFHKADKLISQEKYILTGFFYKKESGLLIND
jgi:hypothetical protein